MMTGLKNWFSSSMAFIVAAAVLALLGATVKWDWSGLAGFGVAVAAASTVVSCLGVAVAFVAMTKSDMASQDQLAALRKQLAEMTRTRTHDARPFVVAEFDGEPLVHLNRAEELEHPREKSVLTLARLKVLYRLRAASEHPAVRLRMRWELLVCGEVCDQFYLERSMVTRDPGTSGLETLELFLRPERLIALERVDGRCELRCVIQFENVFGVPFVCTRQFRTAYSSGEDKDQLKLFVARWSSSQSNAAERPEVDQAELNRPARLGLDEEHGLFVFRVADGDSEPVFES